MRSNTVRLILLTMLVLAAGMASRPALAQGNNLLQNPSFEGGYSSFVPQTAQQHADCPAGICTTVQVPAAWQPWWAKEWSTDVNPEYKPATAPFTNRIHSGSTAGQYFSFYRTHKAGYWQQASVPANATVLFTVWGQAWVSNEDSGGSDRNAPINMRVGIDPTGGTNPYAGTVVWSGTFQPYDAYQQFSVSARAQGSTVTVFTYSAPSYPMKHNDVYWDDASLTVGGAGAPAPAPAPVPAPAPAPAPSTGAGGTYTVVAGDTLYGIARRFGVDFQVLVGANNIANPSVIRVGQVLTIPGGGTTTTPPPAGQAPPASGRSATTQVNLRLRSGPGISFQSLAVAPAGSAVSVLGRNAAADWLQVQYAGQTGWMAAWFLQLNSGTVNELPVTG